MNFTQPSDKIPWDDIVIEISPGLLRYFLVLFRRAVAAELVQETLLRLVVKVRAGDFHPSKGNLRMYAYGIARLVRFEGRRLELKNRITEANVPLLVTTYDSHEDDQQRLRWAVSKLKQVEQDIILLLLDKELSLANIADALDMPLGTVKSHVHRAKGTIKDLLNSAAKAGES